jgi:hypothetical protein
MLTCDISPTKATASLTAAACPTACSMPLSRSSEKVCILQSGCSRPRGRQRRRPASTSCCAGSSKRARWPAAARQTWRAVPRRRRRCRDCRLRCQRRGAKSAVVWAVRGAGAALQARFHALHKGLFQIFHIIHAIPEKWISCGCVKTLKTCHLHCAERC